MLSRFDKRQYMQERACSRKTRWRRGDSGFPRHRWLPSRASSLLQRICGAAEI